VHAYRADHAFDGARVLDGGALVLVDDGRIVGVEPARAAPPDGCPVTHLPGTTLLPGLVDTHVHLCGDASPTALDVLHERDDAALDTIVRRSLAEHLAAGVTAVRDLGDARFAVVDRHRCHPDGPTVVASGPPVTVPRGHCWPMGGEAAGADALRAAVRERTERGADVVKVMTSGGIMTPGTDVTAPQYGLDDLRVVVDAAHAAGLPVTGHAHAAAAVALCVEAGLDGIEHGSCLTGDGIALPDGLLERLVRTGIVVCPTLGRRPGAVLPPRVQEQLDRLGISYELVVEHVGRLAAAGVRVISGADTGIGREKPHGVLPWGLVDLASAGVPPVAALASATGDAADAIGLRDRTGRLRAGLDADLLLVDGDPARDITAVTRPRLVVSRGREVTPRPVQPSPEV
jgi:imidazolonepropionase-like amidohydrolase